MRYRPQLLATPTGDLGKLLSALSRAEIGGTTDLATSVQIAQLALKHRENKNQRQRIVVFVGSPLSDSSETLVKLGKKLRKNNVVIDVVTFGDEGQAEDGKLEALVDAAGKNDWYISDSESSVADMLKATSCPCQRVLICSQTSLRLLRSCSIPTCPARPRPVDPTQVEITRWEISIPTWIPSLRRPVCVAQLEKR